MYNIIGIYKGEREVLDQFNTMAEAIQNRTEYIIAYGPEWLIQIVKAG